MSRPLTQLRQQDNRVVDLRLRQGCVVIQPIPRGLRKALTIQETIFKGSRPEAGEFHLEPFNVDRNGSLTIAPGLLSRAVNWLKTKHYHCRIHDERITGESGERGGSETPATVIDAGSNRDLPPILRKHSHGTFVIAGAVDATQTLVNVCRCLPTAKIGIVAANRPLAREWGLALSHLTKESPCWQPGNNYWYDARIRAVPACHLNAFHGTTIDVLIIILDHNAISQPAMERLLALRPAPQRVYALRQQGRMNDAEAIAVEAIAGPVIYTSPRVRRIHRQYCRSRSFADLRQARDLESRQRIWQHEPRNRWIAEVAQACVNNNDAKLWEHGLFLSEEESLPGSPSVSLLVESTTHAQALSRYLIGWPVLEMTGGRASVRPGGRIITLARMAQGPVAAADVMILAAGDGRFLPPAPHYRGQMQHVIVLADGLYETRRSHSPANPGETTVSFPVISSHLSHPETKRKSGLNREDKGNKRKAKHSRNGGVPEIIKECVW